MERTELDLTETEVVEEASAVVEDRGCALQQTMVGSTAMKQGISCQQVFRNAFTRVGQSDTVSRALFVRFLGNGRAVPEEVVSYCERQSKIVIEERRRKGFCMGCTLNPNAFEGLRNAYQQIRPDVFQTADGLPSTPQFPSHHDEADMLFLDLLDSGILHEEDDRWSDLIDDELDGTET